MKIGIDLTAILPLRTGVDNYHTELVTALACLDDASHFSLFMNHEDSGLFEGKLGPNFSIIPITRYNRGLRFFAQQVILPAQARHLKLDVMHSPSFFSPLLTGPKLGHVVTVHDLTMFTRPVYHTRFRRSLLFRSGIALSAKKSDIIIVPSRFVKAEALRLLPGLSSEKIRVIPMGVSPDFNPEPDAAPQRLPAGLEPLRPYILFVGNIEPRKNLKTLIKAYRNAVIRFGLSENLIIAGKKDRDYETVKNLAAALGLSDRVVFTGYVPRKTLAQLYRKAAIFVYPSIEEGFGFPPLEAMACGVPTIAADNSSLRENLLGAAELVSPLDAPSLEAAMTRLLRDEALRLDYQKKGLQKVRHFRWENTARMTLECYREAYGLRHLTR